MGHISKITAKNLALLKRTWGEPDVYAVIERLAANAVISLGDNAVPKPSLKYRRARLGIRTATPLVVNVYPPRAKLVADLQLRWEEKSSSSTLARIIDEAGGLGHVCNRCINARLLDTGNRKRTVTLATTTDPQRAAKWKAMCLANPGQFKADTLEMLIAAAWVSEFRPPCNHTYTQARLPV